MNSSEICESLEWGAKRKIKEKTFSKTLYVLSGKTNIFPLLDVSVWCIGRTVTNFFTIQPIGQRQLINKTRFFSPFITIFPPKSRLIINVLSQGFHEDFYAILESPEWPRLPRTTSWWSTASGAHGSIMDVQYIL